MNSQAFSANRSHDFCGLAEVAAVRANHVGGDRSCQLLLSNEFKGPWLHEPIWTACWRALCLNQGRVALAPDVDRKGKNYTGI